MIFLPKDYYDSNDSKVKLDRRRYLEKYINETRKQQRSDIESTDQTSYADIRKNFFPLMKMSQSRKRFLFFKFE